MGSEVLNLLGTQAGSEAMEGMCVGVVWVGNNARDCGLNALGLDMVLHLDNILALDELGIARDEDWSG